MDKLSSAHVYLRLPKVRSQHSEPEIQNHANYSRITSTHWFNFVQIYVYFDLFTCSLVQKSTNETKMLRLI